MVSGNKPSTLFWFTISSLLTAEREVRAGNHFRATARHLLEPEMIFEPIWALAADPEHTLHSLTDLENRSNDTPR
jgi:hypothetical protein